MILTGISTALAALLGWALVPRWSAPGFVLAAVILLALHMAVLTLGGFEGSSWEESLLLFNGSVAAFLGFNFQVSYRALALPIFVLGLVSVWRIRS